MAAAGGTAGAGKRIAAVGPLPVDAAADYTAVHTEAPSTPGRQSVVHRDPGPEAGDVLARARRIKTPDGTTGLTAGASGSVCGGTPRALSAIGSGERRSQVCVPHGSSQRRASQASDWTTKGLCKPSRARATGGHKKAGGARRHPRLLS